MEFSAFAKRAFAIAATILLMLGLGSTAEAKPPNVSRDLMTPGTLIVGSDIPYPPFEFGFAPGYDGFDIDLVDAMARKLRLKVKYVDTRFDSIFDDLRNGDFDLVASATTITPERRRYVRFTKPNFDAQQSLVVVPGSAIRSLKDLSGTTVGAQDGTSGEAFARDNTRASQVVTFPNGQAVIRALKKGKVDAVILDQVVVNFFKQRGQRGFKAVRNISIGERYAYAVEKSSTRLLRGINWAFGKVRADGSFKRIYRKWFGINPPPSLRR